MQEVQSEVELQFVQKIHNQLYTSELCALRAQNSTDFEEKRSMIYVLFVYHDILRSA